MKYEKFFLKHVYLSCTTGSTSGNDAPEMYSVRVSAPRRQQPPALVDRIVSGTVIRGTPNTPKHGW